MLKCIQDFAQGEHRYTAGDVVNVHPAVESWLLDSFPAYFERIDDATNTVDETEDADGDGDSKDIDQPPADKMIRRANRK